jgi:hypothetical protein
VCIALDRDLHARLIHEQYRRRTGETGRRIPLTEITREALDTAGIPKGRGNAA